jgi:hypothetical protein
MRKRKKIDAASLANDALRLRDLAKSLENRGLLLASDPRYLEQIGAMQNELDKLRRNANGADYVAEDTCFKHPADASRTLCGDVVRDSITVTSKPHAITCGPCLRAMVECVRAYYGLKQETKSA